MTAEFQAGTKIGEYILDTYIGGGSFGAVWRGHHESSGELVAVKMLTGALSSSETAGMRADVELLAASAASRSQHVVHVLGGGVEPVPHIVMEYIEGSDLLGLLREKGKLSSEQTIGVGLAISDALGALNEAGIIHRDIKPANVMIDKDGVIKLADFGIAKIVGYETMTMAGQAAMTMAYAAPEIWDDGSSFGRPSHKSDLYAMGVLLYQCMTGDTPFRGNYGALYRAHTENPPDLDALPADAPPSLRSLVQACLAKRQEDRPADAEACTTLLRRAQSELASASGATNEPKKLGPWIKDALHESTPWAWHAHHDSRGDLATVEVHFAPSLDYAAELRKALMANRKLTPLGAEQLIETNRLLLHPDEAWTNPPAGRFQFWIAREDRAVEGAASVSRAMLRSAVPALVALNEAAAKEGIELTWGGNLTVLPDASIYLRRPGLASDQMQDGDDSLLACLHALPLEAEAQSLLASVRDIPALLSVLGPAAEDATAIVATGAAATQLVQRPVETHATVIAPAVVALKEPAPEEAVEEEPVVAPAAPPAPVEPPVAVAVGAMANVSLGLKRLSVNAAVSEYELSLANHSSRPVELYLDASDDNDALTYSLQRRLVLSVGASEQVRLRVESRKRPLLGSKRSTAFEVSASQGGSGEPPLTTQGEFEEQPRLPIVLVAGVFGLAIAGLLAAVALAGGGGDGNKDTANRDAGPDQPAVVAAVDTATAVPSPVAPVVVPDVVPAAPQIRTCDQIRASGTYNSDQERSYFISSCGSTSGSNPPAPTATPVAAAPGPAAPANVAPAPAATAVPAKVPSYTVAGWATTSPSGACVGGVPSCLPPSSTTPDGGSLRACNAPSLYVWIQLSNVQVPTSLTVQWFLPGSYTAVSGGEPYPEKDSQHLFWARYTATGRGSANSAPSIPVGTYTVELRNNGSLVKTTTVTVTC